MVRRGLKLPLHLRLQLHVACDVQIAFRLFQREAMQIDRRLRAVEREGNIGRFSRRAEGEIAGRAELRRTSGGVQRAVRREPLSDQVGR